AGLQSVDPYPTLRISIGYMGTLGIFIESYTLCFTMILYQHTSFSYKIYI
ncbi:hypothetical protein LINPERHAP1_LOCUS12151, partial [Linum perenne]